ncbi:hypothetical protein FHT40_001360 [Mycolicibacterium sp. BK556]|uniref:hypothetical protein n=1 Tax=unclassified Mycolicibacterium TaxID=2636767 RepID=UPI001414E953|nr:MULTISPECIES: hypothetical protein [unclassified Mycolicibacterium]MBB3601727.1 hypothetical protein [Mycolicibacterium sp. BK556]MBB3631479.1 hypothetical protein [Mycolicibacterium sp. BK607]
MTFSRQLALAAGFVAIVGVVGLSAGCGQSSKESPSSTTSSTSSKPAPSPTEKGVIQMPPRAFNQNQSAADGMLALQSQGYNVQLNFAAGSGTDRPLSQCKITSVDGLRGDNPPANTTVFLTVDCPSSN